MKRKIWLSGENENITMLQRDLEFCKILFLLNESDSKSDVKINVDKQTTPLFCDLKNGELIKVKSYNCRNGITKIPITLDKKESILLVFLSVENLHLNQKTS